MNDKTYYLKSNIALYLETLKEFSSKPFLHASLNEIIKNSNFNKGSFYYRFEDKFDLYQALLTEIIIKQYDYIDKLNSITLDTNSIKAYISILFESQLELFMENNLYISLFETFYKETDDFKKKIYMTVGIPLIDVFCKNMNEFLVNNLFISANKSPIFLNQVKQTYFNLHSILNQDFSKTSINLLIEIITEGILLNKMSTQPNMLLSIKNMKHLYYKTNVGIHNFSISINQGEIISIVGPSKSGKSTICNVLQGKINSQNELEYKEISVHSKSVEINHKKSLIWNLKKYSLVENLETMNNLLLSEFQLNQKLNAKISKLPIKEQKIIELILKSIISKNLIIMDDLYKTLNDNESRSISNYLLKCRGLGSTIILTSSHVENVISISDKIAFILDGHLINIKTIDELQQKYGKITHIIEYIDGNNTKIAAFSNENFNSDFFKQIIDHYQIKSMKTKTILPDEIFKLETGVNL